MTVFNSQVIGILAVGLAILSNALEWEGQLVFEENFDGDSLDLNKWEYQEACGNQFGGDRLQCYTRNNVAVSGGNLVITARPERMEDKNYTSGRIRQTGEGFAYGAYVARARLARGDHLWPAIWLFPIDNDCRYEEIDILEYRGQAGEAKNAVQAAHWGRSWDVITSKGFKSATPYDLSADFHEYAVLWTPSKIEWFVDDHKYNNVSLTDGTFNSDERKWPCKGPPTPYIQKTNFILNMAVGGPFFGQFPPMDPSTWTKPTVEIDWVRIYQA